MVDYKLQQTNILRRRCNNAANNPERDCTKYFISDYEIIPQIKKRYLLGAFAALVVIGLIIGAYYGGVFGSKNNELIPPDPIKALPPSGSQLRVFKRAAVCADSAVCAKVGNDILIKNGTAADAAIATLLCNGVVTMQSMGLGGGFLMTLYKRDEKKAYFLNAREKAPLAAKNEMYKDDQLTSRSTPLAVGVPGELKGYVELHKKFGTLPWKDLVQPALDICNKGYIMSNHQYQSLFKNAKLNKTDPNIKEWFLDKKGKFKKAGSKIVPKKLCNTLRLIQENGGEDFYNGTLANMFVEDIQAEKGLITLEDLAKYNAEWINPMSMQFNGQDTLYSSPPPGSGAILTFIMGILDGYNFTRNSIEDPNSTILTYHRIIESYKYAYARRTELGDMNFVNLTQLMKDLTSSEYAEDIRLKIVDNMTFSDPKHYGAVYYDRGDHGTAHISIIDQNGDAISVTSSINIFFGNGRTSPQTGIIYNSVMDDFSFPYFENYFGLPGSPNNEMKPEKRPLSSMSPTIIVDKDNEVKMVIGASGGTTITSCVAWAIVRSLWFGENIKEVVDAPRLHHQLYPMRAMYEYGMLKPIVDGLESLGHQMLRGVNSVICALKKTNSTIYANADYRKGGDVFGKDT
ncbi:unnamed protein product [Ceutorhynchus assimilis]|uniref:Glutathione hydrolase 1 proenzyme-like n=1 Tax=Ceutorhynchus assimilis TaxID=467358 RepID=A0A9N9N0R1_9CUCU|nr:unnamed protein product [Ceutorhynchus assimilis]